MTKLEFIDKLRNKLSGLPQNDIEERLNFYSEMIDDQIEEGVAEQDAILAIGTIEEIAEQIVCDTTPSKIIKENATQKRRLKAWEIILLTLGSPIWLSLLIAAFAVILSLYISLWAVIIAFWSAFISFIASALGGILGGIILIFCGKQISGIAIIGAALVCAGISIFIFMGCRFITKLILHLTRKILLKTKKRFIKKEVA